MKIVNFEKVESKENQETIDFIINNINKCNQFVFIYSNDDLNTVYHEVINLNNVELIGLLDCIKHTVLHEIFPDE